MSQEQPLRATSGQREEVVYTPDSRLRDPAGLLAGMARDLWASRHLAWRLMVRDISARYRQSFFGILWAFAPPLLMAAGFTFAKQANFINVGETDIPYPAYVMLSTALWQVFVEALNGPSGALAASAPLMAKIRIPPEAPILAKLGDLLFDFLIKLILIVGVLVWFRIPLTWAAALAPFALLQMVLLGTVAGLILAPFCVLYQDLSRVISIVSSLGIFFTPVFYPPPQQGVLSLVVHLNPVTPLLVTTRELVTTGVVSSPTGYWTVTLACLAAALPTWLVYRLAMPFVIERVGS